MDEEKHKGERIAKCIARAGICSRRDAEKLILEGRVKVNGKVIESPALNVIQSDKIIVNDTMLPEEEQTRLFLYHKPPGLVTTHKDEMDRATVFDHLPDFVPRVVSVGRLDLNSEGLLLLTNDGGLARYLELPDTGWARRYRVRVHGKINEKRLASLKNGITIEGVRYKSIDAAIETMPDNREHKGTNTWLSVTLREGKNREIRRVMEALGLKVTRLIRTDYGPFSLGKISRGSVEEVKADVLGHKIAEYFESNNITFKSVSEAKNKKTQFQKKYKNSEKNSSKTGNNRKNSSKKTKFYKKSKKS